MDSIIEKQPKVSVVMSVYKERQEWICEAIESILKQTFNDFEFIIVYDCPENKESIKIITDYSRKDDRIRYVVNETNIGLTKSLNKGLRISKGEYIVRIDADDVALPNRLLEQVRFMDNNPDVVASGTAAYYWDGNKILKRTHRNSSGKVLRSMIIFDSPIYHPAAIFRRIVDGIQVTYNEEFRYSQDYALWISLQKKYKLSNIDKPLIKYRVSNQQISTSKHDEQRCYALRNQANAVSLLGLKLTDREMNFLQDITRRPEIEHDANEIEDFIISLMKRIRPRKDLDYSSMASHLMLIYISRLSKNVSFIPALTRMFYMNAKIKNFSFYNFFSLISKYLR